jgi:hypothetical protein
MKIDYFKNEIIQIVFKIIINSKFLILEILILIYYFAVKIHN